MKITSAALAGAICLVVFHSSFAGNTELDAASLEDPTSYNRVKRYHRSLAQILKCNRKVINKRRGGREGIHYVYDNLGKVSRVVQKLESNAYIDYETIKQLESLAVKCKKFSRSNRNKRKNRAAWEDLHAISVEQYSESPLQVIVNSFINPETTCRIVRLDATAAIAVSAGVGFGFGYCAKTNGQRYLAMVPAGHIGVGAFASVHVHHQNIVFFSTDRLVEKRGPDSFLKQFQGGVGLGITRNSYDDVFQWDRMFSIARRHENEGVGWGVGAGYSIGYNGSLPVRIMPLKNDWLPIINILEHKP